MLPVECSEGGYGSVLSKCFERGLVTWAAVRSNRYWCEHTLGPLRYVLWVWVEWFARNTPAQRVIWEAPFNSNIGLLNINNYTLLHNS